MNSSTVQTGLINDIDKFYANLETNCVLVEGIEMDFNSYVPLRNAVNDGRKN